MPPRRRQRAAGPSADEPPRRRQRAADLADDEPPRRRQRAADLARNEPNPDIAARWNAATEDIILQLQQAHARDLDIARAMYADLISNIHDQLDDTIRPAEEERQLEINQWLRDGRDVLRPYVVRAADHTQRHGEQLLRWLTEGYRYSERVTRDMIRRHVAPDLSRMVRHLLHYWNPPPQVDRGSPATELATACNTRLASRIEETTCIEIETLG